jgi:hypothetical protein
LGEDCCVYSSGGIGSITSVSTSSSTTVINTSVVALCIAIKPIEINTANTATSADIPVLHIEHIDAVLARRQQKYPGQRAQGPSLVSLDQFVGVGAVVTEQHAGPDVILLDQVGERDIYPVVVYFYVVNILPERSEVTDCAVVADVVYVH